MAFKYTEDQLNKMDKALLIELFLGLQDQMEEPEELELKKGSRRKQGKKDQDLSGLPVRRIDHYLSEQELEDEFGENGWKQLPDMISRQYCFVPAKVEIEEHHIGVYADKKDEHMVRAPHPKALLHGSLVSPSLGAAVMNGKYVNAVPLYRLEKEFERYGLAISRANMANWMIRLSEEYLSVFYDHLHRKIYDFDVIGADETPVEVNKDGRPAGSKSYIWVYRSGGISSTHHQAVRSKSWGYLVMKQIQAIYREEGKLKDLKTEERLKQRQLVIKPLADALFVRL